ncbi:MAG: hypothetical protein HS100_01700 [Anaerolineales bacterium]|nr:hypothetical protein [Anaerolineales bacterium]
MSDKKKRRRRRNGNSRNEFIAFEYYSRPFLLLGDEITRFGYDNRKPHEIRKRFWSLLPDRTYASLEISPLLKHYINSIEDNLKEIISKRSLAYWLHVYRRIGPYSAGIDEQPITIGLVRAAFEMAFLKYANFAPCHSIGISKETPIENILSGLLMSEEFELERNLINEASKQMVLTDFNSLNLLEIYNAEKLAYELWRSTASLRIAGKGASFTISQSEPYIFDNRNDELDKLVQIYDSRHHGISSTSLTGTSFSNLSNLEDSGKIIIPTYNMGHLPSEKFNELFRGVFNLNIQNSMVFNFLWAPFEIGKYRKSHIPYSEKFLEIHNVELDSVLLTITALCNRVLLNMKNDSLHAIHRYYQRAYEGPSKKSLVIEEIFKYLPIAARTLNIPEEQISQEKILSAIGFLELSKSKQVDLNLQYPGPHMVFLPYAEDRWFIDYAWLNSLLYNLFIGVSPDDQKFKGDILEKVVNFRQSILPTKPCKSTSGQFKQIDASFKVGSRLVIVECKAINKSVAFDKGDPSSIQFRNNKFTDALNEVDEKAQWLANNPLGTNYDIRNFSEILPIVISPFVE